MTALKEVKHHCVFCKEPILPEEKTGYDEGRGMAAMRAGKAQHLKKPLTGAIDSVHHRHMAQLSATTALFLSDSAMPERLETLGVTRVTAMLLYVTDEDVEFIALPEWWMNKGPSIVQACGY